MLLAFIRIRFRIRIHIQSIIHLSYSLLKIIVRIHFIIISTQTKVTLNALITHYSHSLILKFISAFCS